MSWQLILKSSREYIKRMILELKEEIKRSLLEEGWKGSEEELDTYVNQRTIEFVKEFITLDKIYPRDFL